MRKQIYIVCSLLLLLSWQCTRKEEVFITDSSARLSFSEQVLLYDTLFADLEYPAKRIKVYNRNSGALEISEVALAGGLSSPFKILVNGQQGPVVRGLELMGGDSMVIVINLFFSSMSQPAPYLVEDSIRFIINGQEQKVLLKAVGQDALLIPSGNLLCGTVWDNSKPIILLGETVVPAGCSLTIGKGARILASRSSSLNIQGTLLIHGEKSDSVYLGTLASGRNPGQWKGIQFYEGSNNNYLSWFQLLNAEKGLSYASSATSASKVDITIDHGVFHDFTQSAIDLSYTDFKASNCLFYASSGAATRISKDASAEFLHCTWASFSYDYYRTGPSIEVKSPEGALSLSLKQCIIWGDNNISEISFDPTASVAVDSCLVKSSATIPGAGNILNQDPRFESPVLRNYRLKSTSPVIDKGLPSAILDDLDGKLRDAQPDWGCYEYQP